MRGSNALLDAGLVGDRIGRDGLLETAETAHQVVHLAADLLHVPLVGAKVLASLLELHLQGTHPGFQRPGALLLVEVAEAGGGKGESQEEAEPLPTARDGLDPLLC